LKSCTRCYIIGHAVPSNRNQPSANLIILGEMSPLPGLFHYIVPGNQDPTPQMICSMCRVRRGQKDGCTVPSLPRNTPPKPSCGTCPLPQKKRSVWLAGIGSGTQSVAYGSQTRPLS
jgi:hypothetical protein